MTLNIVSSFNGVSDPDAAAYIEAVEAADNQLLEFGVGKAINDFVLGCKADGIWDAIKASCILAGARTTNGALVPLKGTAPTPYNFDLVGDTDYNRKTGLVGDGSTKYLNSNLANNVLTLNSVHLSAYISDASSANSAIFFTTYGSTPTGFFVSAGNNFEFYLNSLRLSTGISSAVGFAGASRSAATTSVQRVNGVDTSSSVASGSQKTDSIRIYNDATESATYASNARLAFYSIGEALDLALLDARVTDLITAFGAAIP